MNSEITIKDFYFIYVITGDNYIKSIIKTFDYIPKEFNVVVITNTPNLLKKIKVKFNLIIEDLENLRSDWSKQNEIVPNIQDEQEYVKKISEMYRSGYRYPMQIMRYGIKWAINNNITKFVITDSGSSINYGFDSLNAFYKLKELAIAKNKNLIFGSSVYLENIDYFIGTIFDTYLQEFKECVPYINKEHFYEIIETDFIENSNIKGVGFDGHTYGYWFNTIDSLQKLFDLWENIVIKYYDNPTSSVWAVDFEWIMTTISCFYSRYFNVLACGHKDIIMHLYRPENDFFAVDIKYPHDLDWIPTKTRKDFIIQNRDKLIKHYNGENNVKNIVYEYDSIFNI
jgi:hypothetical protein